MKKNGHAFGKNMEKLSVFLTGDLKI